MRAFDIAFEFRGFHDVARRTAFLVDRDGVIRAAWEYEPSGVPDVDEWLVAARAL